MRRTRMPNRTVPLARRTGLVGGQPPASRPGPARGRALAGQSARKRREREAAQPVVDDVFARDGGCVLRGHEHTAGHCFGGPTPHHLEKQSRKRGGWTHRNLVTLCAGHNDWVESGSPTAARRLGLVVRDGITHREAWERMRTHCLAVGHLVEPCPGAEQTPDTRPVAGRHVCMGCGHSYELAAALDGGPGGIIPPHSRELNW